MKKIILCEGKFDGVFMKILLNNLNISDDELRLFDIEEVPKEKRMNIETAELERFICPRNNRKILVKMENGKHHAIRIYSSIMPYCAKEINNCCLMIDLENGKAQSRLKEIKEKLRYLRRANPLEISTEEKGSHRHLHHFEGTIKNEKSLNVIGNFKIIFFKKSLEISCKINKEIDSEEQKVEKIKKFVLGQEIPKFLSEII